MQTVFEYEIPLFHPLVVHFPIALFVAAAVAALVWAANGRSFWRKCLLFLYLLGSVGAGAAYFTGEAAEEQAEGVPMVDALVGQHEAAALYLLYAAGLGLIGLAAVSFWLGRRTTLQRDPPDPLWVRVVFLLVTLGLAALVVWIGRLGGLMVWGVPVQ